MVGPTQCTKDSKEHLPQLRFVESVRVRKVRAPVRMPWKASILSSFWFLIIGKCYWTHWAVARWNMPFDAIYVWGPTLAAAVLCTVVFLANSEKR